MEKTIAVWRRRATPVATERPAGPAPRMRMSTGEVREVVRF